MSYRKAEKVFCPQCDHGYSAVVDSRGNRRVRSCDACGTRWLTVEMFDRFVTKTTVEAPRRRPVRKRKAA